MSEAILGLDFLAKQETSIDFAGQRLTMKGENIALQDEGNSLPLAVATVMAMDSGEGCGLNVSVTRTGERNQVESDYKPRLRRKNIVARGNVVRTRSQARPHGDHYKIVKEITPGVYCIKDLKNPRSTIIKV